MVIVSTTLVVTLLALVGIATLAGLAILGALAANRIAFHHRARVSRHESIRTYYGHLAHLAH
jgi:hypothetical protein